MNKYTLLKALHLTYLGLLLTFIYFFFSAYQPIKLHNQCAKESAETVIRLNSKIEAFGVYQDFYKGCVSQKSITLLSLLK